MFFWRTIRGNKGCCYSEIRNTPLLCINNTLRSILPKRFLFSSFPRIFVAFGFYHKIDGDMEIILFWKHCMHGCITLQCKGAILSFLCQIFKKLTWLCWSLSTNQQLVKKPSKQRVKGKKKQKKRFCPAIFIVLTQNLCFKSFLTYIYT